MLTKNYNISPQNGTPAEGELYKRVVTFGKTFELRYGYYDDIDRKTNPVVIYPDFQDNPVYTEGGEPFVTMMQDACESYEGATPKTVDTACAECRYFKRGEEYFGICLCKSNRKNE